LNKNNVENMVLGDKNKEEELGIKRTSDPCSNTIFDIVECR
jgi:hypothetical protein